jgi:NAD(P)-dependent dehydrogenase (short-subunit alcohol dehydrogenase family)
MELYERAARQNPSGRATTPEDAARAIAALCDSRTYWITGNVIGVDGGEDLTA